jgi:hypothetical protein
MAVVPLREGGVIPGVVMEPDLDLIAKIDGWLTDAKSGQLRAMAYVMIDRDRAVVTGWTGRADGHDMLGGVSLLAFRYMKADQGRDD